MTSFLASAWCCRGRHPRPSRHKSIGASPYGIPVTEHSQRSPPADRWRPRPLPPSPQVGVTAWWSRRLSTRVVALGLASVAIALFAAGVVAGLALSAASSACRSARWAAASRHRRSLRSRLSSFWADASAPLTCAPSTAQCALSPPIAANGRATCRRYSWPWLVTIRSSWFWQPGRPIRQRGSPFVGIPGCSCRSIDSGCGRSPVSSDSLRPWPGLVTIWAGMIKINRC